jgi:hypothetical protein
VVKNGDVSLWHAVGIPLAGRKITRDFKRLAVVVAAVSVAGCANNTAGTNGDPGPTALSAGQSCQSIRADLTSMDKSGVPDLVERQTAGKKLSASQKAQADLYNRLLNQYLGARCHV